MSNRIKFIDVARGIAIILIILGHTIVHSSNCEMIYKFIYSFHVVLFFILSGYVFKRNEKFYKFVVNKFMRIMIPYFIWAILFLIPYMLLGKEIANNLETNSSFELFTQIKNIIIGNGNNNALKQNSSLWFLPALFSMNIIYYWIIGFIEERPKYRFKLLLLLFIIGYISSNLFKVTLPWGLKTVLDIGVFFYIGFLLKTYDKIPLNVNKRKSLIWICLLLIIGIFSCLANVNVVSCIQYNYGSYILAISSGLSLSLVIILISRFVNNKIIEYIGKNTMGILIFHKIVVLLFQTKFGKISVLLKNSNIFFEFLISILIVAISIVVSLLMSLLIKRTIPVIIGEKNK